MPIDYTVKSGDCISSIAEEHGFFPDTIWDDSANSELKEKREDPNCLMKGDVVVIMDKRVEPHGAAAEKRHRFRKKGVPEKLRVRIFVFEDGEEKPKANAKYAITIDDETRTDRETDDTGLIEESIPPEAQAAVVEFEDGERYEFELGDLGPIETIPGVYARLSNLGYDCGDPAKEMTEELELAIRGFQSENELTVNGEFDDKDFVDTLRDEYEAED